MQRSSLKLIVLLFCKSRRFLSLALPNPFLFIWILHMYVCNIVVHTPARHECPCLTMRRWFIWFTFDYVCPCYVLILATVPAPCCSGPGTLQCSAAPSLWRPTETPTWQCKTAHTEDASDSMAAVSCYKTVCKTGQRGEQQGSVCIVWTLLTLTAGTGFVGVDTLGVLASITVVAPASRIFFLYDAMISFFSTRYGPKLGRLCA